MIDLNLPADKDLLALANEHPVTQQAKKERSSPGKSLNRDSIPDLSRAGQ
jgi:hypothetical protein